MVNSEERHPLAQGTEERTHEEAVTDAAGFSWEGR